MRRDDHVVEVGLGAEALKEGVRVIKPVLRDYGPAQRPRDLCIRALQGRTRSRTVHSIGQPDRDTYVIVALEFLT